MKTLWYSLMILVVLIFGTFSPALKIISDDLGPLGLNFLRFFIASVAMYPFVHKKVWKIPKKDHSRIFFISVIGILTYAWISINGLKLSNAGNFAVFSNTWVLFAFPAASLFIKEHFTKNQLVGMIVGLFGVIVALYSSLSFSLEFFYGNLLILLGALFSGVAAPLEKVYVEKHGALPATFLYIFYGSLLFLPFMLFSNDLSLIIHGEFDIPLMLYVAIICTTLTWSILYASIKHIGLHQTNAFILLIPITGIIASYYWLGEQITTGMYFGTPIILLGIWIVQKDSN